jgi:hypothetical protein
MLKFSLLKVKTTGPVFLAYWIHSVSL